jgi:VIT1/CCC1 family predicted Fe2+/Mn2+ transporter
VILGGLAELFSGSISMGLGAYLAAQSDSQRYDAEVARIKTKSTSDELAAGKDEVVDMLMAYGASDATAGAVVGEIMRKREGWVKVCFSYGNEENAGACVGMLT